MRRPARVVNGPIPLRAGDELAADVAAGATELPLTPAEFDENGGWLVVVDDSDVERVLQYDRVSDDAETLRLVTGLPVALPAGRRVDLWDVTTAAPIVEYVVDVVFDDQDDGEALPAVVVGGLVDRIPLGDVGLVGAAVTIERADPTPGAADEDTELYVVDVDGYPLSVDGSYIPDLLAAAATATDAQQRTTGAKESSPRTATSGPRIEFNQRGGRGFLDFVGESVSAFISALLEDGAQVLRIDSGADAGATSSALVLRSVSGVREIIARTNTLRSFGRIVAETGLIVRNGLAVDTFVQFRRGNQDFWGIESNDAVRTTGSNGQVRVTHTLGVMPSAVTAVLQGAQSNACFVAIDSKTATEIVFEIRAIGTRNVVPGVEVTINWIAVSMGARSVSSTPLAQQEVMT